MNAKLIQLHLFLCFADFHSCAGLALPDTLTSGLASVVRIPVAAGEGTTVARLTASKTSSSPPTGVTLYEFEACPYCRKVRETITVLDLDVLIKPCPRGSQLRQEAGALGNKEKPQFPFLVDSDQGVAMFESDDIIDHLASTYGAGIDVGEVSERGSSPVISMASGLLASGLRGFRGGALAPHALENLPSGYVPLELYSYENNQFCRPVREVLCELALPYRLKSAGKGSPRRADLAALRPDGSTACPFLVDPNTGTAMGESADIIAYLERTYSDKERKESRPAFGLFNAKTDPTSTEREALKEKIRAFGAESRGGVMRSEAGRMEELVAALEKLNPAPLPATSPEINGVWELLWTTEDEILFAMEKGLFLDGPCSRVTQTISRDNGRLQNRIEFEGGGFLSVDSSLLPNTDETGFSFKFDACSFGWRDALRLPLPPVGEGEFKVTYIDAELRVQRDVTRGNTLVLVRG